jgi:hypothetical protein
MKVVFLFPSSATVRNTAARLLETGIDVREGLNKNINNI